MKTSAFIMTLHFFALFITSQALATFNYSFAGIQQRIIAEAKRQDLTPSLALAIAKVESNFNPNAISHAGAKGVMQIMPRTAEQAFGVPRHRLFEPDINIKLGVSFIKQLIKRYDNRLDLALSHYNGGSGVKTSNGELRVIPATRDYVKKVLNSQQEYLHHDRPNPFILIDTDTPSRAIYSDIAIPQTPSELLNSPSQNPQVETLRALRLHNITRNYYGARNGSLINITAEKEKTQLTQATRKEKIAKVRLWESIYLD